MSGTNGNGRSMEISFDEGVCERYLLGELDGEERERFESSYFNDDAFFNRFMAVKDELLDLYSRNELDNEKRQRLEKHFGATPPRRKQLNDSTSFIRAVTVISDRSERPTDRPPSSGDEVESVMEGLARFFTLPKLVAAVGLIIAVTSIGWLVVGRSDKPDLGSGQAQQGANVAGTVVEGTASPEHATADTHSTRPERENPLEPSREPRTDTPDVAVKPEQQPDSNASQVASDPPTPRVAPTSSPESRVAVHPKPDEPKPPEPQRDVTGDVTESVTLASASRAITKSNTANVGRATRAVAIRLVFGGEAYSSYAVRVTTLGGQTVWRVSSLKTGMNAGAKSLSISVPAGSLQRKDYIVTLEGRTSDGNVETIREYYLHVDRQ